MLRDKFVLIKGGELTAAGGTTITQATTMHETGNARPRRRCRRKYGDASSARHRKQCCIKAERFRRAVTRSGSRSGVNAQPDITVAETASRGTPVRLPSNAATRRRGAEAEGRGAETTSRRQSQGRRRTTSARSREDDEAVNPTRQQIVRELVGAETGHRSWATSLYRSRISMANHALCRSQQTIT
ncbi:MAG: hypothetical protein EOR22_32200 [Mesorhizobium sp.]|nr:MAG: hypothetical protein EOR22_32200 [Mesorhizobium sp.]